MIQAFDFLTVADLISIVPCDILEYVQRQTGQP
jgi:hypothetical protein